VIFLDRKKFLVIFVSLLVAAVCTLIIVHRANVQVSALSKTATAYEVTNYVPMRSVVTGSNVKAVRVPVSLSGVASDPVGKTAVTALLPGDLIFANQVSRMQALPPGMVSVVVAVNQSTSGAVTSGDIVDVYSLANGPATLVVQNATVLGSYDAQGNPVGPAGGAQSGVLSNAMPASKVAAAVDLMVPAGSAQALVAGSKSVYLVRVR